MLFEMPLPESIHLLCVPWSCADSSLGLRMYSYEVLRYPLRPELWGAKPLSSSLGRELFNSRFFMAASIYPGLGFSMFLFPCSRYHF